MARHYYRDVAKWKLNSTFNPSLINVIAEGDSWLNIPVFNSNVAWELAGMRKDFNVLNLSKSGELIANIAKGDEFEQLTKVVGHPSYRAQKLLLSGGGNDILAKGDAENNSLALILKTAPQPTIVDYIDEGAWQAKITELDTAYRALLTMCAMKNPNSRYMHILMITFFRVTLAWMCS